MSLQVYDETTPINISVELNNASGTTRHNLVPAQGQNYRIDAITAVSTDTSDRVVDVIINTSGNHYAIGSINVPAGSGTGLVAAVNLVEHLVTALQAGLVLNAATTVDVLVESAITSGKVIDFTAFGGLV